MKGLIMGNKENKFDILNSEKNSFVNKTRQTVNTPKKTVQKTTIDLTQEEYEFLKRQKEENGITTRGIIRMLLRDYMKKMN
jgi:ribbon-helix-helix protein, copG family